MFLIIHINVSQKKVPNNNAFSKVIILQNKLQNNHLTVYYTGGLRSCGTFPNYLANAFRVHANFAPDFCSLGWCSSGFTT